jgi:hypothetical protein
MARITAAHSLRDLVASGEGGWKESILRLIGEQFRLLASQHPGIYVFAVYCIACLGYAYLLLFPVLFLVSSFAVFTSLSNYESLAIGQLLLKVLVFVMSALVTYSIARFRPDLPESTVKIPNKPSERLFELVGDYIRHYQSARINSIAFTSEFELDVIKTPRLPLPIWHTTTLVIGMPVIQCLSVTRFQCALARRVGQNSRRRKWKGNLLYQLRNTWPLYAGDSDHVSFGYQPIRWFFAVYAPVYRVISAPLARADELAADTCAMELFSDDDVLDLMTVQMACLEYLEAECLPVVEKMHVNDSITAESATAGTVTLICKLIHGDRMARWICEAGAAETGLDDTLPCLAARVQNIGHTAARMCTTESESAAGIYLARAD